MGSLFRRLSPSRSMTTDGFDPAETKPDGYTAMTATNRTLNYLHLNITSHLQVLLPASVNC